MIIITLPKNIKSDFEGYNYFLSTMAEIKSYNFSTITFDFIDVKFFEANLCAILGTIFEYLEHNNKIINLINFSNSRVLNVLRKNEFLVPYGFGKVSDNYDTTLVYKKFNPSADRDFYKYIQEQLLNKSDFPSHSELLGKKILENIFELYENARTHGLCNYIHTCGQFFPNKPDKPFHFTIVDKGITIKENVIKFLQNDICAEKAISWAMIKGNTTKTGSNPGGLGLSIIFEFIQKNGGKIQIVSSDGYYEFANNKIIELKCNSSFDGTIVNLKFNFNDNNYYQLVGEKDFENIF